MPSLAARISDLRRRQNDAERMVRLSPFKADRERFQKIAEEYRAQVEALENAGLKSSGG